MFWTLYTLMMLTLTILEPKKHIKKWDIAIKVHLPHGRAYILSYSQLQSMSTPLHKHDKEGDIFSGGL